MTLLGPRRLLGPERGKRAGYEKIYGVPSSGVIVNLNVAPGTQRCDGAVLGQLVTGGRCVNILENVMNI